MPPVTQSTDERPVPQGPCASLKPDMVYVQRGSCPAEALTLASEISSQADAPISFGSLDIPADIANTEVEEVNMDQEDLFPSAQSFAIATLPTQAESTHEKQEEQPTGKVDLEDENDIQLDQAETEVPEDSLMLFQQMVSSDMKTCYGRRLPCTSNPITRSETCYGRGAFSAIT